MCGPVVQFPVQSIRNLVVSGWSLSPRLAGRLAVSAGVLTAGHWLLTDVAHIPGGGFGVLAAGAGLWWLSRPVKPPVFQEPESLKGWIQRCNDVLRQFAELETVLGCTDLCKPRAAELDRLLDFDEPLSLGVVATAGTPLPSTQRLQVALAGVRNLDLCIGRPLPVVGTSWSWPADLQQLDVLLHVLPLPLRAADLLWLEQLPVDRPVWLLLESESSRSEQIQALNCQLPERWHQSLLPWNGTAETLRSVLQPVRRQLDEPQSVRDITRQRLLRDLHRCWQADLEGFRRERFRALLQQSQWIVAGVVAASPLPSVDLLAVVVGNGLMVKEMAAIWNCPWSQDVLQAAVRQLGGAALAQGVVEWSGQALLGLAKLDGASWLAAGAVQALSAAYLTRVVGASMADWMALNAGVAEPDLEELKRQAPLLVARAADRERLDLRGFADQARDWIRARSDWSAA